MEAVGAASKFEDGIVETQDYQIVPDFFHVDMSFTESCIVAGVAGKWQAERELFYYRFFSDGHTLFFQVHAEEDAVVHHPSIGMCSEPEASLDLGIILEESHGEFGGDGASIRIVGLDD